MCLYSSTSFSLSICISACRSVSLAWTLSSSISSFCDDCMRFLVYILFPFSTVCARCVRAFFPIYPFMSTCIHFRICMYAYIHIIFLFSSTFFNSLFFLLLFLSLSLSVILSSIPCASTGAQITETHFKVEYFSHSTSYDVTASPAARASVHCAYHIFYCTTAYSNVPRCQNPVLLCSTNTYHSVRARWTVLSQGQRKKEKTTRGFMN